MALRLALELAMAARKRAMFEAYFNNGPLSEDDRRLVKAIEEFRQDFFELDEDDLRAAMEKFDEHERHSPDGI